MQEMQEVEVEGARKSSIPCPRCDSIDTKFCYYNNYNTSQPRHFCKNCKRYWTAGGSLRNVPVGGTLRKNKKSRTSSSSAKHTNDPFSPDNNSPSSGSSSRINNGTNSNSNSNFNRNPNFNPNPNPSPSSSSAERDGGGDESSFPTINGFGFPNHLGFRYPSSDLSFEDNHVDPSSNYHSAHFNYLNVRSSYHEYPTSGEFYQHISPPDGVSFHGRKEIAKSNSADVSEVASLRSDQVSSEAMVKDPHQLRLGFPNRYNEEGNGEALRGPSGFCQPPQESDVLQCPGNSYVVEKPLDHSSYGGKPRVEEEEEVEEEYDDDLEDVVNVRYPFDWEQVSEVLFGGTPDFVYLPGR